MNVETLLAAAGVAVCVALLVHQWMGAGRQAWLSGWWAKRVAQWLRAVATFKHRQRMRRLRQAAPPVRRPGASEAEGDGEAAREAAELIERARKQSLRNGHGRKPGEKGKDPGDNVVRPPRFGNRRNDLH